MQKLQEVSLTLRLKVDPNSGVFPAIESATVLAEFVQFLRHSVYSTPLENEGTHLHKAGAVQWSLKDGESDSPKAGLDEGVRSQGGHANPEASRRSSERSEADGSGQSNGKEGS